MTQSVNVGHPLRTGQRTSSLQRGFAAARGSISVVGAHSTKQPRRAPCSHHTRSTRTKAAGSHRACTHQRRVRTQCTPSGTAAARMHRPHALFLPRALAVASPACGCLPRRTQQSSTPLVRPHALRCSQRASTPPPTQHTSAASLPHHAHSTAQHTAARAVRSSAVVVVSWLSVTPRPAVSHTASHITRHTHPAHHVTWPPAWRTSRQCQPGVSEMDETAAGVQRGARQQQMRADVQAGRGRQQVQAGQRGAV